MTLVVSINHDDGGVALRSMMDPYGGVLQDKYSGMITNIFLTQSRILLIMESSYICLNFLSKLGNHQFGLFTLEI